MSAPTLHYYLIGKPSEQNLFYPVMSWYELQFAALYHSPAPTEPCLFTHTPKAWPAGWEVALTVKPCAWRWTRLPRRFCLWAFWPHFVDCGLKKTQSNGIDEKTIQLNCDVLLWSRHQHVSSANGVWATNYLFLFLTALRQGKINCLPKYFQIGPITTFKCIEKYLKDDSLLQMLVSLWCNLKIWGFCW